MSGSDHSQCPYHLPWYGTTDRGSVAPHRHPLTIMSISTSIAGESIAEETMILEPLTELERGILEYLIDYLRQNTYQPSIREIGKHFGIKSTKTVAEHLEALAQKGWIERDPARSRGIRILGLELDTETLSIPILTAERGTAEPPTDDEGGPHLSLDQRLVGATRAFIIAMPDDSLTEAGIFEGDLLVVTPISLGELETDDLIVIEQGDQFQVTTWSGPEPLPTTPEQVRSPEHPALLGRANTVIRSLSTPITLKGRDDPSSIDVHTPAP